MNSPLKIDRTVNINTLIAGATFVCMLVGGLIEGTIIYSKIQVQADAWIEFQKRQEEYNSNLDADRRAGRATYDAKLDSVVQIINKLASSGEQQTYQIAQLQKKDEETDARLGRMTESYGDKFTEIQTTLATMSTQLALQSQAMTELKQIVATTRRLSGSDAASPQTQ